MDTFFSRVSDAYGNCIKFPEIKEEMASELSGIVGKYIEYLNKKYNTDICKSCNENDYDKVIDRLDGYDNELKEIREKLGKIHFLNVEVKDISFELKRESSKSYYEYMKEKLGLTVELFNPFNALQGEKPAPEIAIRLGVAAGLAMRSEQ